MVKDLTVHHKQTDNHDQRLRHSRVFCNKHQERGTILTAVITDGYHSYQLHTKVYVAPKNY
jgi:hypothetical protein